MDRESVGGRCDDDRDAALAAGPGTPWCSLERAVAAAPQDAIVHVRAGSHPELKVDESPARGGYVTFRPQPGERVTLAEGLNISGTSWLRLEGFRVTGMVQVKEGSHHIALVGNDVDGRGVFVTGATDVLVERNRIHDLPAGLPNCSCGVRVVPRYGSDPVPAARVTIRGNRIESLSNDAVQVADATDVHVERNVIRDVHPAGLGEHTDVVQGIGAHGLVIRDNDIRDIEHGLMFTDKASQDVTIVNNVLADVSGTALKTAGEGMPELRVLNNTFWEAGEGVALRAAHEGAVVSNNIFDVVSGLGAQPLAERNLVARPLDGEDYGAEPILAAPVFADPAGDLQLASGSPGIDAGAADGAPGADMRGRPRRDDPEVADSGTGEPPYVDVGALEREP